MVRLAQLTALGTAFKEGDWTSSGEPFARVGKVISAQLKWADVTNTIVENLVVVSAEAK
jgi:hypothetical protein